MSSLKESNIALQKKKCFSLELSVENGEQYSRRTYLRITNIPCEEKDTREEVLKKLKKKKLMKKQRLTFLKKPLTELIMLVQRKKNRAIIVKFSTFRHRSLFYRARKNLKTYIKLLIYLKKKRFNLLLAAQSFIQGKKKC